jgi:hypothetical protein
MAAEATCGPAVAANAIAHTRCDFASSIAQSCFEHAWILVEVLARGQFLLALGACERCERCGRDGTIEEWVVEEGQLRISE